MLYKSLASTEDLQPNALHRDARDNEILPQASGEHRNQQAIIEQQRKELAEAKAKIREIEAKLGRLEANVPRKYPDVRFLNYKNRKRILVTYCIFALFTFAELLSDRASQVGNLRPTCYAQ